MTNLGSLGTNASGWGSSTSRALNARGQVAGSSDYYVGGTSLGTRAFLWSDGTLTNLGSGSRGGTRGCVGALTTMRSWEVSGKQVVLKDLSGSQIATLYKSGDTRYDGSLSSGGSISLSR